jgi:hypothetical protein
MFHADNKSAHGSERERNSLELKKRRGDLYENKGSAFYGPEQSGNVIENTGSYALKAGRLMKLKVVSTS